MAEVDRTTTRLTPLVGTPRLLTMRWNPEPVVKRFEVRFRIHGQPRVFIVTVSAAEVLSFKRFRTAVAHQLGIVLNEPMGPWDAQICRARDAAAQADEMTRRLRIRGEG